MKNLMTVLAAAVVLTCLVVMQSDKSMADISCYVCQGYVSPEGSMVSSTCFPNITSADVCNGTDNTITSNCVDVQTDCQACITAVQYGSLTALEDSFSYPGYWRGCFIDDSSSGMNSVCGTVAGVPDLYDCVDICNTNLCNYGNYTNNAPANTNVNNANNASEIRCAIISIFMFIAISLFSFYQ